MFLVYTTSCQLIDTDGYHAPPMSPRCSNSRIEVKPSARAAFARTIPVAPGFNSSERRQTGADNGDGFDGFLETVRFRSVLHLFIEEGRSIEIAGLKYANYIGDMTAFGANSSSIVSLIETQIYPSISMQLLSMENDMYTPEAISHGYTTNTQSNQLGR